jgi:hypothetical protein
VLVDSERGIRWRGDVLGEGDVGVGLRGKLTCSALMTSMITPPFNMRARPALTEKLFSPSAWSLGPWPLTPLVMGRSDGMVVIEDFLMLVEMKRGIDGTKRRYGTGFL